jgi:hypothetical protein
MHHVAVLKKSWKLLPKILAGEKTIESRWYKIRTAPWGRVAAGDTIFFKDSGEPVTARAEVAKVLQFERPSDAELHDILRRYGGTPGIAFHLPMDEVFGWARSRSYVMLMFLKDPRPVAPFDIDKTGFGASCAWLTVEDIARIRKNENRP